MLAGTSILESIDVLYFASLEKSLRRGFAYRLVSENFSFIGDGRRTDVPCFFLTRHDKTEGG